MRLLTHLQIPTECSVEAPLRVESTNNDYETSGTFGCQSGYYLYLKDGSEPSGTQTTCLITAEWENYDQFACYQRLFQSKLFEYYFTLIII